METQFTERLECLIQTKPFSSLSEEEKIYVLSLISEKEYCLYADFLQDTIKYSQLEKNTLKVSENTPSNLQQAFHKKHIPFYLQTVKIPYINFKIPSYQPIAASLILGLMMFSIYKLNKKNVINNETDYYLSEEEFNKYTQFDNTAYYVTIDEFQIEDEVTNNLMNMEFTNYSPAATSFK